MTVTIVAGFRNDDGVVLCADTQETLGNISKRNVPKLRFEPSGPSASIRRILGGEKDEGLAAAFCGSTDNGPFLDMLVDQAWAAADGSPSLQEACIRIKQSIKDTHREYRDIYQPGVYPYVELIYGVKMQHGSKLFHAVGPAITEKDGYVSGGVGAYLADFLASRMYDKYLGIQQLIIIAAYILLQAKEHVKGCGGESHIAVLRNNGMSGLVHFDNVDSATRLVKTADKRVGQLLMDFANLGIAEEEFVKQSKELVALMADIHKMERLDLEQNNQQLASLFGTALHDDLGLPTTPPDPPTGSE